jgi:hypothetical protein
MILKSLNIICDMSSHLRLDIYPHNPWIVTNETIDKQYCKWIQCELIKYVSKSLNFSYQFIIEGNEKKVKSSSNKY